MTKRIFTEEHKAKLSLSHMGKGHPQSLATRQKISQARKGKIPNGRLGKKHSEETKKKISQAQKLNSEGRYNWQREHPSYNAVHAWIRRKRGSLQTCWNCDNPKGRFEWANISGEYKRDFADFVRLCSSCHNLYDNNKIILTLRYKNEKA